VRRLPLLALLLLLTALAAGCGSDDDETAGTQTPTEPRGTTETTPTATEAEQESTTVRVYFMRGEKLGVGSRTVEGTPAIGRATLDELLTGPNDLEREAGLASEVPEGTQVHGLAIDDGHAVVDLSRDFESGGGSLSMQARVAQIVYSLTQFPTVDRVSIRLDGEDVDGIGGEGVPAADLTRADFEEVTPQILVESPAVGDRVTSPLRIQGTANTFEANFMVELDAGGQTLVEHFVTATSGSGERGTFDATFEFDLAEAGPATLIVYEASAASPPEGGTPLHRVEIPVELAP
jgi:germination protein M